IRVGSTGAPNVGIKPRPVNMHDPALISAMVRRPAGWPRNSRSAPRINPRARATQTRMARSTSPVRCVLSAPAGTASGSVLRAGLVLGTRLVGKLRQVQAVHEVAEHGEAFFVDHGLDLVLAALGLVGLGNDAGAVHHLGGDEDRTLDAHGERDRIRGTSVEVEVAAV